MKTLSIITITLLSATLIRAQVPDSINQNFKRQYPEATNATWKTMDNRHTVTYRDALNMENSITYDSQGKVYSRYSEVSTKNVPSGISEYYKKNYPNETKYRVYMETDNLGVNSYYINRKDGERLYFDNTGKYTRKTPPTKVKAD